MSETLKLGVVGLRNIGKGHIRRCTDLKGADIVAVADTLEDRLQEAKAEFGIDHTYTQAEDLFSHDDLDGVILAVPNHFHSPLAIAAMEASLHVLVEKPIAQNTDEARKMIAVRDRTGRTLMIGMNQRYTPLVYGIRNHIASGILGEIYYAKTKWVRRNLADFLWERGDWFLSRQLSGGGPMIDLGVHIMDLMLHLMGFPKAESVSGLCFSGTGQKEADRLGKPKVEVEDFSSGLIRLEGGRALHIESSFFLSERDERIQHVLYGEKGGLDMIDRNWRMFLTGGEDVEDLVIEPESNAPGSSVAHFTDVLHGRAELSSTAEQGLEILRIIEALYESAESGTSIQLS